VISHKARVALVVSAAATLALYLVPYGRYAIYPLLLISTLVHELGHGVAAVIVGGDFLEFKMWGDGSGVAYHTAPPSGAARAFISAGGLCGPAVAAAGMFAMAPKSKHARWALGVFGGLLAVALLLVVRNQFGAIFTGILAASTIVIAVYGGERLAQGTLLFLGVQLALSVYSRGDYLFKQWAETAQGRMPSDSQQMADALGGAYWFWGGACAVFSAAMLGLGAYTFWRGTHAPAAAQPKSSVNRSRSRS
jgi:hypothetical protein